MIYLYGITAGGSDSADADGIDGARLHTVPAGSLSAVCSTHEHLELRPEPEICLAHERVVEALMRVDAVLPARFGTTFEEAAELTEAVANRESVLRRQLEWVRGCVELAVRIANVDQPAQVKPADGRSYLESRGCVRRRAQSMIGETLEPLAALAVESDSKAAYADDETVTASYLVRGEDVARFCDLLRGIQRNHPQLVLSCTGPWPPYSFASGEAA